MRRARTSTLQNPNSTKGVPSVMRRGMKGSTCAPDTESTLVDTARERHHRVCVHALTITHTRGHPWRGCRTSRCTGCRAPSSGRHGAALGGRRPAPRHTSSKTRQLLRAWVPCVLLRPGIPCGQGHTRQAPARPRAQHCEVLGLGQLARRQVRQTDGVNPLARRRVVLRLTATRGAAVLAQAGAPVNLSELVAQEPVRLLPTLTGGQAAAATATIVEREHARNRLNTCPLGHRIIERRLPGSGDRRTCNSQKDKLLKSSRAVRPDGCSDAHPAQDDEHPTAVLAHLFSSAESSAFTRQRQKHAKVHHANVSTSAKTRVLCVQEWFLSRRDRLKKSQVLARAT
eukprot:scaffold57811_cov43-Phaeocystis_antarctica.AAC.1